ncbi:hypothetical protein [Rhizobium sp. Root483D2]|uniref:hypothetical protein n=1 Tax=Rhizobium sp. Root483D2 TaxID=1736545 RepID=UPI000712705C|nr:hypothetical protein [Rhizobium sp. Root483D2]KQY27809.1 hypothetical protein ASD32_24830 [Rhizobium sp. Root483D2]
MTEPLHINRFHALANAYGSNLARWPSEVQAAARQSAENDAEKVILRDAAEMDNILDRWEAPPIPISLSCSVTDIASYLPVRMTRKVRIWWASVGLAAALSGVAAGTVVAVTFGQQPQIYSSTVFGDISGDGD